MRTGSPRPRSPASALRMLRRGQGSEKLSWQPHRANVFNCHSGASRSDEPGIRRLLREIPGSRSRTPRNDQSRRTNPVAVKAVGYAMAELHQRHRTCFDIAGVEDGEIAAVFARAPYRGQQPAVALGGLVVAGDEDRLRNRIAGGQQILPAARSLAVDMHDA